ncbi:MAG TPA: TonB-dependent receptor [Opitutaceae bacterium]|nr:TonB-dependent receptor [Opitutaceae bacterium]
MAKKTFPCLPVALAFAFGLAASSVHAQMVSAGMTGAVADPQGHPVVGANVTAVHTPTNTTFTATTGPDGRFAFRGMPVGGPYRVSAVAGGIEIVPLTDVETSLGGDTDVRLAAKMDVVILEELVTTGSRSDLDANATGAGTALSNRRLNAQPTVNRSFADLMKTNPFVNLRAGAQATALGTNSRYNTILLDGAKVNASFGSLTGLFSLQNPFSLEAIEQVSVSLTPYDIRQTGFTGLAMNVLSKSGTNEFHGSVYNIYTDETWQGKDLVGTNRGKRSPLEERTYGATLGGPIIRDRLFFFLNYERFTRDTAPVTPNFTPDQAFIDAVKAKVATLPNAPDIGTFGGSNTARLADTKRLAKLDWNIATGHRLSVRYSDTIGTQPETGSVNSNSVSQPATIPGQPTSFPNTVTGLSSNFFTAEVKEHVWAAQLFNNWTSALSTQLSYSHTKQDSVRSVPIRFPEVRIFNVPGRTGTATVTDGNGFRFGTEISSQGNALHIKTETFGGSADYTWNRFTFTLGADHETSDYSNLFRQGSYGVFDYQNLADFEADKPFAFLRTLVQSGLPVADISKFEQTGIFGQVKWEPTSRFMVTAGIRVDHLGSPIAPTENTRFKTAFGITNSGTIDGATIPAPRLSFNYALDAKRDTQIRGGSGVFLGRNPWVWISNSYGNTGVGRFNIVKTTPIPVGASSTVPSLAQYLSGTYPDSDPQYRFDPENPVGTTDTTGTASAVNLIRPGMKLPTIQRSNLAIDRKIPFLGAVASIEYIDTRQLSALFVDNMNLRPTSTAIDGRQLFAGSATAAPRIAGFANVIRTRDIHAGSSQAVAISLEREMAKGWAYALAYTHTHATEAQSLSSSTANSQWQFNPVFNQNQIEVARSDYEIRDRLQAALSCELRLTKHLPTTISLYYEGRSGMPFSYVYSNDLNKDGLGANDLVAVPSGPNDTRFDFSGMTQVQQDAYFAFLERSGLSRFAGGHAPRNAFLTPWQNRLDLRIVQDLPLSRVPLARKAKLQFFADFINFGAWLSPDLFNYVETLNVVSTTGVQTRALGAATYNSSDGRIRPTFRDGTTTVLSLDANNALIFGANVPAAEATSSSVIRPNNAESRWKVQAGIRLVF